MKLLSLLLLLCIHLVAAGQNSVTPDLPPEGFFENFHCPSDRLRQERMLRDDTFRIQQVAFEKQYVKAMENYYKGAKERSLPPLYTVPVVVHIIHSGEPEGSVSNPTNATVNDIISQATDRFLHTSGATFPNNPYSGFNAEIEFCMAQRTPSNTGTTGIVRYNNPAQASPASYNSMVSYMNGIAWNKSRYANLFVISNAPSDYPFSGLYTNDMTIYVDNAFWSGLIAHEMGHYFALQHTFQGACPNSNCLSNGDLVCDTQPKATSGGAGGTCAAPANSCVTDPDDPSTNNPFRPIASGGLGDKPDILENYLDYTASCWAAFTQGQVARMRNNISVSRTLLVNGNNACTVPPAPLEFISFRAQQEDEHTVLLSWETAQEHQVKDFHVEFGMNGVNFEPVGQENARNSGKNEQYVFRHRPQKTGMLYYRIRENDTDGRFMYTGIQSVKMREKSAVSIFPTHTGGYIHLQAEEDTRFQILNATGQLMSAGICMQPVTPIEVAQWPCGLYMVQMGGRIMRFYKN